MSFFIGKYEITGNVLAPMAGYTDIAFRELCRIYGAGLTVTEMVSVRGLAHSSEKTALLMRLSEKETPSCVQLFGNNPDDFARAAKNINCDIIDINMGCPMPKIVKNGDGAALIKNPVLAGDIVRAVKNSTDKPVTVKTRLGYETNNDGAAELIQSVSEAGAAAVTVHGRYAEQRYTGFSDRQKVAELAQKANIPIIYNGDADGDVEGPYAATMIGRKALKNPAVFCGGTVDPVEIAYKHIGLLTKYFDERYTVQACRKFFVHYFAGFTGGKALRAAVNTANTVSEVLKALDSAR